MDNKIAALVAAFASTNPTQAEKLVFAKALAAQLKPAVMASGLYESLRGKQ